MIELDLDALLKEKREEPTTVSISAVNSWLKGGVVFVGLVASFKWLFTKKMWFMLTSITSISIVTIIAIVQINLSAPNSEKLVEKVQPEFKVLNHQLKHETDAGIQAGVSSGIEKEKISEKVDIALLSPRQLFSDKGMNSYEPIISNLPLRFNDNEPKDYFTQIEANGFVHFTLINGSNCSVINTIAYEEGEPQLEFSIRNRTLYLNSVSENKAADLIITVVDLELIKLNGFCEMVSNTTFKSTDLEIQANGFTNFNVDLNVEGLEIEMNGETKGFLNLMGKNLYCKSNGFSEVEIACDFEQSLIEINGFSKFKLNGNSVSTEMEVNGESKVSLEEFYSQELFLNVTGFNKKIETNVTSKIDVEISGKNKVIINGSPQIVRQEVSEGSTFKIK